MPGCGRTNIDSKEPGRVSSNGSFPQPVALHAEQIYHDGTTVFGLGDDRF